MTGRVVSIKMQNTVAVLVTRTATHPLYKKTYVQSKKYLVHDDLGVKMGDIIEMVKIKPVSKRKHWKIVKVVGRSVEEIVKEQLQEKAAEEIAVVMPEEKEEVSVLGDQLSEEGQSVVSESEAEKPKTGKPKAENRKQKPDNRKNKETK